MLSARVRHLFYCMRLDVKSSTFSKKNRRQTKKQKITIRQNRNNILHSYTNYHSYIYFVLHLKLIIHLAPNAIQITNKMSQPNKNHHVTETKTELPFRVAQWFYKHGLFLSSYPTCASSLAIFMVLFAW